MARTTQELFDGPFSTPFKESERFSGAMGLHQIPERNASGNLPDQPAGLPIKPLDGDGPTPWKGLRTGR